jgi:hypothetical protein
MFSYALPSSKACAVAQETLAVWCSLASRLGVWAVKAELEDLCFAVLQVSLFLLFLLCELQLWNDRCSISISVHMFLPTVNPFEREVIELTGICMGFCSHKHFVS